MCVGECVSVIQAAIRADAAAIRPIDQRFGLLFIQQFSLFSFFDIFLLPPPSSSPPPPHALIFNKIDDDDDTLDNVWGCCCCCCRMRWHSAKKPIRLCTAISSSNSSRRSSSLPPCPFPYSTLLSPVVGWGSFMMMMISLPVSILPPSLPLSLSIFPSGREEKRINSRAQREPLFQAD